MQNYVLRNLLLFSAALILAVLLVGGGQYLASDQKRWQRQQAELLNLQQDFLATTPQYLKESFGVIDFLAQSSYPSVALAYGMPTPFFEMAANLNRGPHPLGLALLAKSGKLYGRRLPNSLRSSLAALPKNLRRDGTLVVGKHLVYLRSIQLRQSNEELGLLAGTLPIAAWQKQLQDRYGQATQNHAAFAPQVTLELPAMQPAALGAESAQAAQLLSDGVRAYPLPAIAPLKFTNAGPARPFFTFEASAVWALLLVALWMASFFSLLFIRSLRGPLDQLNRLIAAIGSNDTSPIQEPLPVMQPFRAIGAQLLKMHQKRLQTETALREQTVHQHLAKVARQVSHDIRSPLAALQVLMSRSEPLTLPQRGFVRNAITRIQEIANDLLDEHVTHQRSKEPVQLLAFCEQLQREKSLEFQNATNLQIELRLGQGVYGFFANVDGATLNRTLSNLINNGIEAMGKRGKVVLSLYAVADHLVLAIKDWGCGMDEARIDQLMVAGGTFDKLEGHGLGLEAAKEFAQNNGGRLTIDSKLGSGTTVKIFLPAAKPPAWFLPELKISSDQPLVILDDDESMHQIWRERFKQLALGDDAPRLYHFYSPKLLRTSLRDTVLKRSLFLIDYEFLHQPETGVDLIRALNLGERAILVTGHDHNHEFRQIVTQLGARLLSKAMLHHLPMYVANEVTEQECVLIEDDTLTRDLWQLSAQQYGKSLKVFKDAQSFFAAHRQIAPSTPIYIDVDLGTPLSGDILAKRLHDSGFAQLYLATGYAPEKFQNTPWIKGVIGKIPPWIK